MKLLPIDVRRAESVSRSDRPHARVRHCLGFVVICCSVTTGLSRAQDDWGTRDRFICKSSSEVREIKTYVSNSFGCRVDYIKNGTPQTIWSSRSSRSYCDGKAAELAAKLEASHFSCELLDSRPSDKH